MLAKVLLRATRQLTVKSLIEEANCAARSIEIVVINSRGGLSSHVVPSAVANNIVFIHRHHRLNWLITYSIIERNKNTLPCSTRFSKEECAMEQGASAICIKNAENTCQIGAVMIPM